MSESGLILVLAILVLGGLIATVGDRIGSKVGKARLSLFNLRPRRTATLVTILTGVVVAASTLGILIGTSGPLRKGLFELDRIQRDLRRTRGALEGINRELQVARQQKVQTDAELGKTRAERAQAQKLLTATNKSLQQAYSERDKANATRLQAQGELERNQRQLAAVSAQAAALRTNISQLQAEQQRVIEEGEEAVQAKTAVIQEREKQLQILEAQQSFLAREVAKLERVAEGLRRGNVAIQRGQILASAVLRVEDPSLAQAAVDQLLREANRIASQLARPGSQQQEQIILITKTNVEQLVNQIEDGQEYVVRVLSAANYLTGETPIQVVTEAVQNQVVFEQGAVVASSTLVPSELSDADIQQRINLLLAASSFRARRMGLLTDTVEIGRVQNLITFLEKLKVYDRPLELRAIAANTTFTAGPLTVEFEATDNGQVMLRSQ